MPDWLPTSWWYASGRSSETIEPYEVPLATSVPGMDGSYTRYTKSCVLSVWSAVDRIWVPPRMNVYPDRQWVRKSPQSPTTEPGAGWAATSSPIGAVPGALGALISVGSYGSNDVTRAGAEKLAPQSVEPL